MDEPSVIEKIGICLSDKPKKKFKQSIELGLGFAGINIQDSTYKLNTTVHLPKGRGKEVEVGVFADGDMNVNAQKHSKHVLNKDEIEAYGKSKAKMRKHARDCYSFIAQPDLLPNIGKTWGVVLGTRGKMPQPVPPNADLSQVIPRMKNTVRLKTKKNPSIHVPVGTEDMSAKDILENIKAVLDEIEKKIPKEHIQTAYVKTTMGQAVRLW